MNRNDITVQIAAQFGTVPGNVLGKENGVPEEYYGTVLFDAPIVRFGSADDALFDEYKNPGIIGPWHMSPGEWLPGAKTIVSMFFPISEEVRKSNYAASEVSSKQWAYARVDGQAFISSFMAALRDWLESEGVRACVPAIDPRFAMMISGEGIEGYGKQDSSVFGSRWSERHAAYVCGLGTFGLSKGLITEKGIAGRFASVIIDLPLPADERPYTGIYDYCIRCGACVRRCPANAIDLATGKDHFKCSANIDKSRIIHNPRYGCGLCQTDVPCEHEKPIRIS